MQAFKYIVAVAIVTVVGLGYASWRHLPIPGKAQMRERWIEKIREIISNIPIR
jgi:hypothetical protein